MAGLSKGPKCEGGPSSAPGNRFPIPRVCPRPNRRSRPKGKRIPPVFARIRKPLTRSFQDPYLCVKAHSRVEGDFRDHPSSHSGAPERRRPSERIHAMSALAELGSLGKKNGKTSTGPGNGTGTEKGGGSGGRGAGQRGAGQR